MKKAIVLFSGGLDSTTCLAIARSQGYICEAVSFNYDQKHQSELSAAKIIAASFTVKHHIIKLPMLTGSSLVDTNLSIPDHSGNNLIPSTYVPARNIIFLSHALGLAETLKAQTIFIGVSAIDYSHYPDCRPEFINSYQNMINLGTKSAVEGKHITIDAPLINLTKAETIKLGVKLGVDYAQTVSCYRAEKGFACGRCDSCVLRKKGFREAKITDPTNYNQ